MLQSESLRCMLTLNLQLLRRNLSDVLTKLMLELLLERRLRTMILLLSASLLFINLI